MSFHVIVLCGQLLAASALLVRSPPQLSTDAKGQGDLHSILKKGAANMTLEDAVRIAKPSEDVLHVLQKVPLGSDEAGGVDLKAPLRPSKQGGKDKNHPGLAGGQEVTDAELEFAMKGLNWMAAKAQERLDAKTLECKDFEGNNFRLFKKVKDDLDRLQDEQSATQARLLSMRESLDQLNNQRLTRTERHDEEDKTLSRRMAALAGRLMRTRGDLQASEFMLDMTKCNGAALMQGVQHQSFQVCENSPGAFEVRFDDPKLQNLTSNLTAEGRQQLQLVVARSRIYEGLTANLLAKDGNLDTLEDGNEIMMLKADPTRRLRFDEAKANKCTIPSKPTCAEMHDIFVGLWGDMLDTIDQLRQELQAEQQSKDAMRSNFHRDMVAFGTSQAVLEASIVDVTSLLAEISGERASKDKDTARMKTFVGKTADECRAVRDEIIHGEMCAILKLRTEFAKSLQKDTPQDCSVGEWTQASECSKPCGGGTQMFQREIIRRGNADGVVCPALQQVTKCNDNRCPVDCKLGSWAAWSDCTQACGGGLRHRTRKIEVEPQSGGFACGILTETQQCNTGACDQNCELGEWSPFSRCSQACDAGFRIRHKSIVKPAVGAGRCPAEESSDRTDRKECNKQKCAGDEQCTSKLDVVLAIDGSGSISEKGFGVVRKFAAKFAEHLQGGDDKVRVGVVQFGNGELDGSKVVSDALAPLTLTTDTYQAASTIEGLSFQRGFTNLAQAAMKSRDVLNAAPRRAGAESLVIFITDGRPTFKHMARAAMKKLKETSRVMVVQVKTFPEVQNVDLLKSYASEPAEANYLHIAGKSALDSNYQAFVTKLLVQACSSVESASKAR